MKNGLQKIWLSEKSIFCLIVIFLSCAMSLILKSAAPFVAATAIVAPVWTFVKGQVGVAAIQSGLEVSTQMSPPAPSLPSPPPPAM